MTIPSRTGARALAGAVLLAAAATGVTAQAPVMSNADARSLMESAAEALGGRALLMELAGFDVVFEGPTQNAWQQARYWTDTTALNRLRLHYVLDIEGRRAARDQSQISPGNVRFHTLAVVDTTGAMTVDLIGWRTGPDIQRDGAAAARNALLAWEALLPHTLVRRALLPGSTLRSLGRVEVGGALLDGVEVTAEGLTAPLTVYLDPETGRPAALQSGPAGRIEYSDYRPVGGVLVPHRRVARAGERVTADLQVVQVDVRPSFGDDRFVIPAGYADPPDAGAPRATRLAEGVYRLDGMPNGYHAAFVVQRDQVVVLEAPQSAQWTEIALRVIGETTPLPVRRVILSHHHSDHVGGAGAYAAAGATIVVGAGLTEAVRRQMPEAVRADAQFEEATSPTSYGMGATRIDVYPVPNEHADGNIMSFLPGSGTLFQGDLFFIPERGEVPAAFGMTAALDAVIRQHGLKVERIVGVHGRTGTYAELQTSLERRR